MRGHADARWEEGAVDSTPREAPHEGALVATEADTEAWRSQCMAFDDPSAVGVEGFQLDPFEVVFVNVDERPEIPPDAG